MAIIFLQARYIKNIMPAYVKPHDCVINTSHPMMQNVIAAWSMTRLQGTKLRDLTGRYHSTATTQTIERDRRGKVIDQITPATTDRVTIDRTLAAGDPLRGNARAFTIFARIKLTAITGPFIAVDSSGAFPGNGGYYAGHRSSAGGRITFATANDLYDSPDTPPLNTWLNIVFRVRNGNIAIFSNGVKKLSTALLSVSELPTTQTTCALLGRPLRDSATINGLVDFIVVTKSAPSDQTIREWSTGDFYAQFYYPVDLPDAAFLSPFQPVSDGRRRMFHSARI